MQYALKIATLNHLPLELECETHTATLRGVNSDARLREEALFAAVCHVSGEFLGTLVRKCISEDISCLAMHILCALYTPYIPLKMGGTNGGSGGSPAHTGSLFLSSFLCKQTNLTGK